MPRDYERSKPLPMHLNITPESAAHYVRRALASLICFHDPEQAELKRPCKKCLHVIEPQVLPVAKALTWAITESRVAVGAAVELLIRDADFELVQFQKRNGLTALKSVQSPKVPVNERDLLLEHRHRPFPSVADSEREGEEEGGEAAEIHGIPADQGQTASRTVDG